MTQHGLDPDAAKLIETVSISTTRAYRHRIRVHMSQLYENAGWQTWDMDSVPQNCNPQAYLCSNWLKKLFAERGFMVDSMLVQLASNLKLITIWLQEVRASEAEGSVKS